jgi:hypothetical protein
MNVFVNLAGQETCAMKILTIVSAVPQIQAILLILARMEDNVSIKLMTMSVNAYQDSLGKSASTMLISAKETLVRMEERVAA